MVLIKIIHKVEKKTCAVEVPCIFIILATEYIHLTKWEMLGFSMENYIEQNEITIVTVYDAPCHDEDNCAEIKFENEK